MADPAYAPPEVHVAGDTTTPQALMGEGIAHHRAKRLAEAEACYRRVLAVQPEHAEALHHLGLARHQQGHSEEALGLIQRALARHPNTPNIHFNLATVLRHLGRAAEADAVYRTLATQGEVHVANTLAEARRLLAAGNGKEAQHYFRMVLTREPKHVEANYQLGVLAGAGTRFEESLAMMDVVLAADPRHVAAHAKRGLALMYLRRLEEARRAFDTAYGLDPRSIDAMMGLAEWHQRQGQHREALPLLQQVVQGPDDKPQVRVMLANTLVALGQLGDGEFHFRKALEKHPNKALVHNNLAECLFRMNRFPEAMEEARAAIKANPKLAEGYANLGNLQGTAGKFDEAVASYLKALELNPKAAAVQNNIGGVYMKQLRMEEAMVAFQKALELRPDFPEAHSNILYLLTYQEPESREALYEAHAEFGRRHADPVYVPRQFANDRDPGRRLRIGFISADYRDHPVTTFIEALFQHHDRAGYEFFAYSDVGNPDVHTRRLQAMVPHWVDVCGMPHEQVAERILADRIDLLVDLTGHMASHRLMVFARKPAPVQVGYMGYLNTTGMRQMDYWLADGWVNPPETQAFHTETLWPLPRCFVCFTPPVESPAVVPPPCVRNGFTTFGIFNNASKVQPTALRMWTRVLQALPTSRLMFKAMHFADPATRSRFLKTFTDQGIAAERVHFLGPSEEYQYLLDFGRIDIALDTFPNNGNTTTHDTLWMGVPVVAMQGNTCVSRVGYSILRQLGHEEWVAESEDDYLRIVKDLAGDTARLQRLRNSLRGEMTTSKLIDGVSFSRDMEAAFRGMWRRWCETAPTAS